MNPWDVLKNNDFGIGSGNDILLGTSGSLYRVILAVAVVGLAWTGCQSHPVRSPVRPHSVLYMPCPV